jgi:alkylation response protein AidB-like acyl-CoA dehydrogenase
MILGVLKNYKAIYNTFHEVGTSFPAKDMVEQDRNNFFDRSLWNHFSKNGLHGLLADESHAGKGFSALKTCVAYEALAYGCENNGMIFSSIAHLIACVSPLSFYGNDEQKDKYLKKMASGQWISANAITEYNAGSDVYNMASVAVKKGSTYTINGEKKYITNAPVADILVVYALTDKTKGFFGGVSCFIVKTDSKDIKVSKVKDKMGLRTAQMGDIKFNNFEIDEDCMIGKPGAGGQIFNNSMIWERVVVSAFLVGQLDRVLDKAVLFTKKRKLNNKNLFEFQNIQHKIADIKTILNAGKNLVYDAAYSIDTKPKNALTRAAIAKLFVSEHVVNAIKQLQEIYGAYGYLTEAGIEREYRDSFASLLYSGTSAIQRNIISADV